MSEDRKDKRTRGWSVLHEPLSPESGAEAPEPTVETPAVPASAGPEPTIATGAPPLRFPLDPLARTEPGLPPRGMSRTPEDTVATPAFDTPPARRAPARDDTVRAPVRIPPDETDPAVALPLRAALVSRVHPPAPTGASPAPKAARDPRPRLETRPLSADDFAPGSETALDGRAAGVSPLPRLDRDDTPPPRPRERSTSPDRDDTPPPRGSRLGARPADRDDTPPPRPRASIVSEPVRRARPSALPSGIGTPVVGPVAGRVAGRVADPVDGAVDGVLEGVGSAISLPLPDAAGASDGPRAAADPDWDPELDAAPAAPVGVDPRPAALRGFTQIGRAARSRKPTGTFRPRLSTPIIELELSRLELGGLVAVLLMIGGLYWIQHGSRPPAETVATVGVRTASVAASPRPVRSWRDTVVTTAPAEAVASFELPAGPTFTPQPASALRSDEAPADGVDAGAGAASADASTTAPLASPRGDRPVAPATASPTAPPTAPPAGSTPVPAAPVKAPAAPPAAPSLPMLTVISAPSGADVELDGRPLGRTPLVRPAPAGVERLELRLRLAGHKDWVGRVVRDDTGHFVLRAPLERR